MRILGALTVLGLFGINVLAISVSAGEIAISGRPVCGEAGLDCQPQCATTVAAENVAENVAEADDDVRLYLSDWLDVLPRLEGTLDVFLGWMPDTAAGNQIKALRGEYQEALPCAVPRVDEPCVHEKISEGNPEGIVECVYWDPYLVIRNPLP